MKKITKERVQEILDRLTPVLEAHKCYMEISAVKDNKIFIYCGGEGAVCEDKCVDPVIKKELPGFEVVYL